MRTRTLVPYAAYMRVYEPLTSFSGAERQRLDDFLSRDDRPDRHRVLAAEQAAALGRALATPPKGAPDDDATDAYVIVDGSAVLACPVQERVRCWLALRELCEGLPDSVADVFAPAALTTQAELDFAVWQASHSSTTVRILTSTWHIPARWFVPFHSTERMLQLDSGTRSLIYRTPMVEARRRVARTARMLRQAQIDGTVLESIDHLGRWLENFHPHGLVELDYGGLVQCVADDDLLADDSPGDIAAAVAAIADGDTAGASLAYQRVITRWERIQAREHAS